MKDVMELFAELGSRLQRFGTDAATRQVVEAAHAANGWFLPEEIVRAACTIGEEMLRREQEGQKKE